MQWFWTVRLPMQVPRPHLMEAVTTRLMKRLRDAEVDRVSTGGVSGVDAPRPNR